MSYFSWSAPVRAKYSTAWITNRRLEYFPIFFTALIFLFGCQSSQAQSFLVSRGVPTIDSLKKAYLLDTAAGALVLSEFQDSRFVILNGVGQEIQYNYRTQIKIQQVNGLDAATVTIKLNKFWGLTETVSDLDGSSYTLQNDSVHMQSLNAADVIKVEVSKYLNEVRFSIPGARAGSIIEYHYTIHSQFDDLFRSWHFESKYPKLSSLLTAVIPKGVVYNISLKGYPKLDYQHISTEAHCLNKFVSGYKDCSRVVYARINIPAWHQERYMCAAGNYISKIQFDLVSSDNQGTPERLLASSWLLEDKYLARQENFGLGMKTAQSFYRSKLDTVVKTTYSDSIKAVHIYTWLQKYYKWNHTYSTWAATSPGKLWAAKSGDSGELNFALVSALRSAGLTANPLLVALRSSNSPSKLFPAIHEFDNVIAVLDLSGSRYFLDITNRYMPFGLIAEENLSHEGRLFPINDSSRWIPLEINALKKTFSHFNFKLSADGSLKGKLTEFKYGYDAFNELAQRRNSSEDDYLDLRTKEWPECRLLSVKQQAGSSGPAEVITEFEIEKSASCFKSGALSFSPFLGASFFSALFAAKTRLYPIDFGYQNTESILVDIEVPAGYKLISQPDDLRVSLPDHEGYFIMNQQITGNVYELSYRFAFSKAVYLASEYEVLKEFVAEIVKTQQKLLVFGRIQ